MTQIVQVNVTQTIAPAPNTLQRTGTFVSQGATTLTTGTTALITQMADLTAILAGAKTLSAMTWSANVVTATATAHGFPIGETIECVIAGVTPAGYNGTFQVTFTDANTITYPLLTNPGSVTVQGTLTDEDVQELVAMGTTYFAQGSQNAVYVLELGAGDSAHGVTALTTYLAANPLQFYAYLVPSYWSSDSTFITLARNNESTTAKVYFYTTVTLGNYTTVSGIKSLIAMIQAVAAPVTECSIAAMFWVALNYNPSTTNKVTPMAFSYVVGVTPYNPTSSQQTLFKNAFINYIGTGAEGGISNTLILWGTTSDGRDFTYWYSVDWVQININLDLSNEIINGSNNPINPLYYDQNGINRLQARAQGTMNRGITYGLVLAPVVVDAVPFPQYVTDNPSDYPIGKYAGLSTSYTPARGFIQIIFNINVTDFPQA